MAVQIQHRRGTAAAWTAANTVLADGEMGFESDTKFIKIGDGITVWTSLAYSTDASKANIASPTFTGTPLAPTAASNINSTQLATTEYVTTAVAAGVVIAEATAIPEAIINALGDLIVGAFDDTAVRLAVGANGYFLRANSSVLETGVEWAAVDLSTKANLNSPDLTGTPTAPTAALSTNTTQIATTEFVLANAAKVTQSSTAPSSPQAGALWFNQDTAQTFIYYDSQWIEIGASGMAVVVSTTAPTAPISGLLWYNSDTGGTYVYYNTIWVEVGAAPFNYIMNTINAKGDLLVGTADNAITGVTVGTNGQVLTAASGEVSGVAWATPTVYAAIASPTFTGTVTIPTPYTIGAVSMTATGTELNYVDGVTSAIQTQLDAKATMGKSIAMSIVFGGG